MKKIDLPDDTVPQAVYNFLGAILFVLILILWRVWNI